MLQLCSSSHHGEWAFWPYPQDLCVSCMGSAMPDWADGLLVLDRVSSERVLTNWRQCLPSRRPQLLQELRAVASDGVIGPSSGLADWLDALAMEPADF